MNVAGIINDSIVDGPGLRFTIFVQGCPHNCPGCHNPETHDYNKKCKEYSVDELFDMIKSNPLLDGVTFSGGEPFSEQDVEELIALAKRIKNETKLKLLVYTGYTLEEIIVKWNKSFLDLMDLADYLVDGPFIQEKKSLDCKFRGSTNQRFFDLNKGELLYENEKTEHQS